MLKYIKGDIFNSPAQVLVNTVNTVGVMGKGIALSFKKKYPEMFTTYRKACDKHQLIIGKLMLWYGPDHWILNFPTKEHWRNPSKMEYIEKGLMAFQRKYADYNITSIAFPKLGCGNGELDWKQVKPLMEKYLKELPIDVYIYLSPGIDPVPEHKVPKAMNAWLKEHAKDMSFTGVKDEIVINSSIIPINFLYKNISWDAHWDNKTDSLIFNDSSGKEIIVEEKTLQTLWDNIQNTEIFNVTNDEATNLVYFLLASMGYLTSVKIQDQETDEFHDGYQLDAGSGRYFSIKG
ncbi:RNase III inhibitor [Eubacteriaceae bacterium CHKCI004]|nr:RNase III inhibitor [Eubacteriaceae bacterium CHKCI004]